MFSSSSHHYLRRYSTIIRLSAKNAIAQQPTQTRTISSRICVQTDPQMVPTYLTVPLFPFFRRNALETRSSSGGHHFVTRTKASNKAITASVQLGGTLQRLLTSGSAYNSYHVSGTRLISGGNEVNRTVPRRNTLCNSGFLLHSSEFRGTLFTPPSFSSRSGICFTSHFTSTLFSSWCIASAAGGHGRISCCWFSSASSAEPEKDGDHVITAPIPSTVVKKSEGMSHFDDNRGESAQDRRYDSLTSSRDRRNSRNGKDSIISLYRTINDASAKKGNVSRPARKKRLTSSLSSSSSSAVESINLPSTPLSPKGSRKSNAEPSSKSRGKTGSRTSLHRNLISDEGKAKEEASGTMEKDGSPERTTTPHTYPVRNENRNKEAAHRKEPEDQSTGVTRKEEEDEKNEVKSKQKRTKRKSSSPTTNTILSSVAYASSELPSHKENQNNNKRKLSIRANRLQNEQPESSQAPLSGVVVKEKKESRSSYGACQPTALSEEKKRKNRGAKQGPVTVSHLKEEVIRDSSPPCSSSLKMLMTGKIEKGNVEETAIPFCRAPDIHLSTRTLSSVREAEKKMEVGSEKAAKEGRSEERRKDEEKVKVVENKERESTGTQSSSTFSSFSSESAETVFPRRHYSWGSIHRILREIRQRKENEESSGKKKSIPDTKESEEKLCSDSTNEIEKENKDSRFLFPSPSPSFARLVRRPPPRPPRSPRPPFSSSPKGYEEKKWSGRPYGASPSFSNSEKPKYDYRFPARKPS